MLDVIWLNRTNILVDANKFCLTLSACSQECHQLYQKLGSKERKSLSIIAKHKLTRYPTDWMLRWRTVGGGLLPLLKLNTFCSPGISSNWTQDSACARSKSLATLEMEIKRGE